jgi:hypothetical protein
MYGGALQEAQLLAFAYDLEQELQPREQPQFLHTVPADPPDAGLCTTAGATAAARSLESPTAAVR